MNKVLDQVDWAFIVEFTGLSFLFVALYVIIANLIAYVLMRKRMNEARMNEAIREFMKRFLFKVPVLVALIGFMAGLCAYFGLILMDTVLHANRFATASSVNFGRKAGLVVFTLFGICLGTLNGLALFFKACKAVKSSVSTKE